MKTLKESILSSTGSGFYNMPLNDKTLKMMGYELSSEYSGYRGSYVKTRFATHNDFTCNLQNRSDEDDGWFTIFHQEISKSLARKLSISLGPDSDNGMHRLKIYFKTTGQLKEFEKYFRIKDDASYTNKQKEQLLYQLLEKGYKFSII